MEVSVINDTSAAVGAPVNQSMESNDNENVKKIEYKIDTGASSLNNETNAEVTGAIDDRVNEQAVDQSNNASKSDVSIGDLMEKIKLLEEENKKLKEEKEKKNKLLYINPADVYENLRKLQNNFRDTFARNYKTLKQGVDLRPWIEAAAKSRKIDASIIAQSISPKNRQLLACIIIFLFLPMSMLTTLFWAIYGLFFDKTRISLAILLIYLTFIYFDKRHYHGSIPNQRYRQHRFWKYLASYFPVLLVKKNPETVFSPDEVYMFGYHPHGVISVGCFVSFAADVTGFSEMFPGITPFAATLVANFYVPFWRELIMRLGAINVSATSIKNVLSMGPGNAVVIVPGGAAEALDAHPGRHSLTLNRRQGFFRIALQHGACLVPTYSFGENDLYEQVRNDEGSLLRRFQNVFLKYAGFATPFFSGAGSSGVAIPMNPIPARVPIITVVGDPIKCPKIEEPTQEDIDQMRVLYVEKLNEIFKQFADEYAPQRSQDLEIVK